VPSYYAKRGDAGAATPIAQLLDGQGDPISLRGGATVRFLMKMRGASGAKVAADAEIVDKDLARVRYVWTEEDLDAPGVYRAEYEVTYGDASVETFPPDGWITVVIRGDLDDEES
jgi:hypothetical protein